MSFSKRYRIIVILVVLFVISLFILSLNVKPSGKTGFFKKLALELVTPLEGGINAVFRSIGDAWDRYIFLVEAGERNRELTGKVAQLNRDLNESREMSLECLRLRELLDIKAELDYRSVAARVVGKLRPSVFKTMMINKGTADGIREGCPVVAVDGIVGRVIEASWDVSKVLLLIDYNSNIDAMVQETRVEGILQGGGEKGCNLKYVQRAEQVTPGDMVVTSGLAGVFPKGLIIGRVLMVEKEEAGLFQKIRVNPAVDLTKLEEVLILVMEEGEMPK